MTMEQKKVRSYGMLTHTQHTHTSQTQGHTDRQTQFLGGYKRDLAGQLISVMAKRKTLSVWNVFQKEEEFATCLVKPCEIKLKHSGNTTNLLKLLKCIHFQQYEECLKEIEDEKRSKRSKTECPKQLTLKKPLDKATFYPKESTKRKNIDNALIEMIVTDLQPTSVVEDNGFQKFVSVLDPHYELPSRRTVVTSLLLEKYTSVKQTLKIELDRQFNDNSSDN